MLACCSAAGYALPPFVILDRLTLKEDFTTGEVPGTICGLSRKGWIDGDLFEMWFVRHFLAHTPPVRPILLMDGHSSHYQPAAIQRAAEEGVIMFTLPPHTSHLTQPLDRGCFGPLKVHWRRVLGLFDISPWPCCDKAPVFVHFSICVDQGHDNDQQRGSIH